MDGPRGNRPPFLSYSIKEAEIDMGSFQSRFQETVCGLLFWDSVDVCPAPGDDTHLFFYLSGGV